MRPTGMYFNKPEEPGCCRGVLGQAHCCGREKSDPLISDLLSWHPGERPFLQELSSLAASEGSSNHSLKSLFVLHFISLFLMLNGLGRESCQGWDGHPDS